MKRVPLFALAVAFAVASLASVASPQTIDSRYLSWRTSKAGVNYAGYLDSLLVSHSQLNLSITLLTSVTDTTETFSLPDDWVGQRSAAAAGDSTMLFAFALEPTFERIGGVSLVAAADTAWFTLQGTYDGVTWTSAPQVAVVAVGNTVTRVWNGSLLGQPAATNVGMTYFPTYRIISWCDFNGAYRGRLTYWKR